MNAQEIYRKAMEKWGYENQENVLIEECGELIQACIKRRRGKGTSNLMEELVDVEIMVEQIKMFFSQNVVFFEDFKTIRETKLKRLESRVNGECDE